MYIKYLYKDEHIKIRDASFTTDIETYSVYVNNDFKGLLYYDRFAKVYTYAYGSTFRGRMYLSKYKELSIRELIDRIKPIYHIGGII